MALPRELRNAIFEELWKLGSNRVVQCEGHAVKLYYGGVDDTNQRTARGLPSWLLTNKTCFIEGMQQFSLRSIVVVEPRQTHTAAIRHPVSNYVSPGFALAKQAFVSIYTAGVNSKLFDLSTTRELNLKTSDPIRHLSRTFAIPLQGRPHITRLLKHLHYMKRPYLQAFRLSTKFSYHQYIGNAPIWILNLKWLEQFRLRVDRFEYEIKGLEFLHCPRETVAAWKHMQGAFSQEVTRIGRLFVDEEGKLEVKVLSKRVINMGVWRNTLTWRFTFEKSKK
jgi:hypothetical protein